MKFLSPARALATFGLFASHVLPVSAIDLDPTQPDQVRNAAKKVADELMAQYATVPPSGGGEATIVSGIPGLLTYPPYYWWEAGAMFGQMIDYWYYTNDSTYNNLVRDGILHQVGDTYNLMPANQSKDEGNDDQLFWAFTVMSAAELNFTNPPDDTPGWLGFAQSVFNQLVARYEIETNQDICGGGLRWQIYTYIPGYNYKNTAANGGMFQLGARLAKYTNNQTYADWAEKAYDWMAQSPLLTKDGQVNDGTDVLGKCKEADQTQWTYNYGIMIGGAAYMYNYTNGSQVWADRLQGFLNHTSYFFPEDKGSVMVEICEEKQLCNIDQWSFKAYLSRWLAVSAQLAPFTHDQIMPRLQHSATAAAKTCTGASDKSSESYMCGSRWYQDSFDNSGGVGQQMSALSVISANLVDQVAPPYSADTGGSSKSDPGLGSGGSDDNLPVQAPPVTTGAKAGAGILTAIVLMTTVGGAWWMID